MGTQLSFLGQVSVLKFNGNKTCFVAIHSLPVLLRAPSIPLQATCSSLAY